MRGSSRSRRLGSPSCRCRPGTRARRRPGAATDERKRGAREARRRRRPRGERRDLGDAELPPLGVERRAAAPSLERDVSLELQAALSAPGQRKRGASTPQASPGAPGERATRPEPLRRAASRRGQTTFGPDHMESDAGSRCAARGSPAPTLDSRQRSVGTRDDVVRVDLESKRRGANVLVQIADGSVVVAPAFRDFLTGLSFDRQRQPRGRLVRAVRQHAALARVRANRSRRSASCAR